MPSTWPAERCHTVSMGQVAAMGSWWRRWWLEELTFVVTERYCDSVVTRNVGKQPQRQTVYLRCDAIFLENFSNLENVLQTIKTNVL